MGEEVCYPNSLCLHLVIETTDGDVVKTRTSSKKKNDYPARWGCSISEQIEMVDFLDETGAFRQGFVVQWVTRAIKEEFSLAEPDLWDIFDQNTIRVLALDLEEDIYNFALVCTVKLKIPFDTFHKQVRPNYDKSEIADIRSLPLEDIPTILFHYTDNNHEYHPSTYMRLYLGCLKGRGGNVDGLVGCEWRGCGCWVVDVGGKLIGRAVVEVVWSVLQARESNVGYTIVIDNSVIRGVPRENE